MNNKTSIHSIGMCRMRRFLAVPRSFFHSSLLYTLSFHPVLHLPSLHLAIYFLVFLSALLLPNSYIILFFGNSIFFYSQNTCPNQRNLFNLTQCLNCCVELLVSYRAPPQVAERGSLIRYSGYWENKHPGWTKTSTTALWRSGTFKG